MWDRSVSVSAARPRILVVDDNEANRLLVVETLEPEGMEVVEAASGEAALEAFAARPFDVVLLDVRMPGLDGFGTLERLRALPGGDAPVVFVTALRDVETFDRAREAGALDFITKPVRPSELIARVETLVRLRRLGGEVRKQLAEIRRQRDDLLRVQLQKERLAAFVVHDLKNPLASIRLHAQLCMRTPGLPDSAREAAALMREQCDRLGQLVMNLLDLSRADEGTLTARVEPMDVARLIDEVIADLVVQADMRKVGLVRESEANVPFAADADLLRRVVANLVDNALRHTPAGGAIRIGGRLDAQTGLVLRIHDTGPGIPPALRERIFDPYVQLEGASSSRSGRGLGLAFCRAAVVAHGGTICVDAEATGACFVITLPTRSRDGE